MGCDFLCSGCYYLLYFHSVDDVIIYLYFHHLREITLVGVGISYGMAWCKTIVMRHLPIVAMEF